MFCLAVEAIRTGTLVYEIFYDLLLISLRCIFDSLSEENSVFA